MMLLSSKNGSVIVDNEFVAKISTEIHNYATVIFIALTVNGVLIDNITKLVFAMTAIITCYTNVKYRQKIVSNGGSRCDDNEDS
jgi:hypothetical protein